MKNASVKKLLKIWEKSGIDGIKKFLNESCVFEGTWLAKIKNLINNGYIISVNEEIKLVLFNINKLSINHKKNNNGDAKNS